MRNMIRYTSINVPADGLCSLWTLFFVLFPHSDPSLLKDSDLISFVEEFWDGCPKLSESLRRFLHNKNWPEEEAADPFTFLANSTKLVTMLWDFGYSVVALRHSSHPNNAVVNDCNNRRILQVRQQSEKGSHQEILASLSSDGSLKYLPNTTHIELSQQQKALVFCSDNIHYSLVLPLWTNPKCDKERRD